MCRKYLQRCQKIFEWYSLISDGAEAGGLIVLLAVDVRAVAELLVAPQHGPPPLLVLEQYSTLHYSTVHYITVQYSTVQYSTVQYSTVPGSASWSRWRVCAAGTCAAGTGDTAPHGTPSGTWQHYTLILGTAKISRLTIMYHPTRGDTTFATSIFYSHFNKSLSSTICFKRRPIRCFKFQQIRKASFVVLKVAPLGGRARWKICNWHI